MSDAKKTQPKPADADTKPAEGDGDLSTEEIHVTDKPAGSEFSTNEIHVTTEPAR